MEKRDKVYWHKPFYEGLQLDLYEYREYLEFENEHPLSQEALRVDIVVVKNEKNVKIKNSIGRIFRRHNLIEFKSETDSLSIWDFEKVLGYAHLYSAFERVPLTDITVTFALTMYPRELIKTLEEEYGLKVQNKGDGIYYVEGEAYPIQILESKKLTDENLFIKNLRSGLSSAESVLLTEAYKKIRPLDARNAYINGIMQANMNAFEEAMNLDDELKEFFQRVVVESDWFQKREEEKRKAELKTELNAELKKVAKNFLSLGDPVEKVSNATGLPLEVVESLA